MVNHGKSSDNYRDITSTKWNITLLLRSQKLWTSPGGHFPSEEIPSKTRRRLLRADHEERGGNSEEVFGHLVFWRSRQGQGNLSMAHDGSSRMVQDGENQIWYRWFQKTRK